MRFVRFELSAFGHFTGRVLDFGSERPGLHLIYGSNEAGKSTAHRAVRGFLYGIPAQSRDTFLHAGSELRLGAKLVFADGSSLEAVRRKGRKNTLIDREGNPLAESELGKWCVEPHLFDAMFGIDHETLRHGAEDLLAGKAGENLFAAGMGTGSVHRLQTVLQQAADDLFTSKSRSKRINQQIAELKQARQQVQSTSISASVHAAREQAVRDLQTELDALVATRGRLRSEISRLERQLRISLPLAQREQFSAQLRDLGPVPELPPDCERRRVRAEQVRQEARQRVEHEQVEIDRVERRSSGLAADPALLAIGTQVLDELGAQLGQHRKATFDLPKREGEWKALREGALRDLRAIGSDLDLEQVESLRLSAIEEQRLQRLCQEKTQFEIKLEDLTLKSKRAQAAVTARRKELQAHPSARDLGPLRAAFERAQRSLGAEQRLLAARQKLTRIEQRAKRAVASLDGFSGSFAELAELRVPGPETLAHFERLESELEQERRASRATARELEAQRTKLERERRELVGLVEVPSREQLVSLRARRDALIAELVTGTRPPGQELRQELEASVARADAIADRLLSEAHRVERLAQLEAALVGVEEERLQSEQRERELVERERALRESWSAHWTGLEVREPREMRDWLRRHAEALTLLEERSGIWDECRALEQEIGVATELASRELVALGQPPQQLWETSLGVLSERVSSVLLELERENAKRADLERQLGLEEGRWEELTDEQREIKERERSWRGDWRRALKSIERDENASAEVVQLVLAKLGELFRQLDEAATLQGRIAGMRRDSAQLEERVRRLASVALPRALELPWEETCELLISEVRRARNEREEAERAAAELEQRVARRERARIEAEQAQSELTELASRAGARDLDELVRFEARVARARQLQHLIEERENEIVSLGEGAGLEELLAQGKDRDAEATKERILALEPELAQCEERLDGVRAQCVSARQELERLEAGASHAAEELAERTATLERSVREYVRLRLSSELLKSEVERYRERHQGPVLQRAGQLFPRLTRGAYSGLRVGFDAKDEQILLCLRDDGRETPLDGLSDGARDQLYLALRLASLERTLESGPCMPLVLDDVLIHFDDARAEAALGVLAEFAERVQVLFFTHHRRIVELARRAIPEPLLSLHELDESGRADAARGGLAAELAS